MPAVSKEFLEQLQQVASPFEALLDRAAAEQALIDYLEPRIPGWDPSVLSDNLRRALPLLAEVQYLRDVAVESAWNAGEMVKAPADTLQARYGVPKGILAQPGEDVEDYRLRLANSGQGRSDSSLDYYARAVKEFNPLITDAQIARYSATNKVDLRVYPLKAAYAALTAAEEAELTTFLNRQRMDDAEGYLPTAGTDIHIEAVTNTAYTIAIELKHLSRFSAAGILTAARQAVYDWLDENQLVGAGIFKGAVEAAARVANVADAVITAPAADLAAAAGTVYVCPKDETNVVFTTTAL